MTKLTPQKSLEQAYEYECQRANEWKALAQACRHDYLLAVAERNEARVAMKIVVLGIIACMLGLMFIMWHYGVRV